MTIGTTEYTDEHSNNDTTVLQLLLINGLLSNQVRRFYFPQHVLDLRKICTCWNVKHTRLHTSTPWFCPFYPPTPPKKSTFDCHPKQVSGFLPDWCTRGLSVRVWLIDCWIGVGLFTGWLAAHLIIMTFPLGITRGHCKQHDSRLEHYKIQHNTELKAYSPTIARIKKESHLNNIASDHFLEELNTDVSFIVRIEQIIYWNYNTRK